MHLIDIYLNKNYLINYYFKIYKFYLFTNKYLNNNFKLFF